LPSATECSQEQPSAELTSRVLPKAPKIPNTKGHVALDASISSVAESKVNKGIVGISTIKKSEKP